MRCCSFSCHICSWKTFLLLRLLYLTRISQCSLFLKMLLVIPGRKWNLLLYASGSSNYNTNLQGIFKLTTLDLSSTKLLIWFFKWILANGSRPPQHLTKHIWMSSMQYLGGLLVKMLIFVTQYLSLVVNTRRRGILTMLLKFLWLKVHKSNYVCIYSFTNEWRHRLWEIWTKTLDEQLPCLSADLMMQHQEAPAQQQLFFISTS